VITLTPTSYIILGLLANAGEATPYDLKQMVSGSVGYFWSVPHSQLYSEPERLAGAGYIRERRERGGRRRKHYSLTAKGRKALEKWLATQTEELVELRDPGILKLFFGADSRALGAAQLEIHRRRLAAYERLRDQGRAGGVAVQSGPLLALEAGIGHEREYIRFWSKIAET
jgi:PadR family transcriptional regulator, regulatory protein AphA